MALKVGELFASFGIDSSAVDGALDSIQKKCEGLASTMTKTGAVLTASLTAPILKAGKDIFSAGTDFYSQMSRVEGISGATADELDQLTKKAIEMGSTTSFTATNAGEALEYMAMAGWKSKQMLDGLEPIIKLAEASGEELAGVSDIVTDALTAFGLGAEDAAMFADVLAAASSNSNTNVALMGETFKYVAPLAGAMKYSIQDTAVAIGLMANAGIKGSQAGTALRNIISNLAKPTDEVQEAMDKLGITIKDTEGNALPLEDIVNQLRDSFAGLTETEKTAYAASIAGKYGMSGLLAIVNATDEDVQKLTESIEGAEGATNRMAETMLDNAKGDVTIFKSAIEGLEITLWGLVEGSFREVIQKATGFVDAFRSMDSVMQTTILKVAGLVAAAGPALLAGGRLVKFAGKLLPLLSALASPIGVVAGGLALFAVAAVDAENNIGKAFENISKKAKTSLQKLNLTMSKSIVNISKRLPALTGSLATGISQVVPELISTVGNLITHMMTAIADNAKGIANVGKTLITHIARGLTKSLPSLIPAAARMATSIASALIENLPAFVEAAGNIAKAIWQGIKNVKWKDLGKQIANSIGKSYTYIKSTFKRWFNEAKKAVLETDWSEVWENIKNSFHVASDWLKNLLLGDAATDTSTWADVGRNILANIKKGLAVTGDFIKKLVLGDSYTPDASWGTVGSALWQKIKSGFSTAGDKIKELILGDEYTPDASWLSVGSAIWNKIKEGFVVTKDWLVEKFNAIFNGEGGFTAGDVSIENVGEFAKGLVEKLLEWKSGNYTAISTFIVNLVKDIAGWNGWSILGDSFKTIATGIIEGIKNAIPKVTDAAVLIINAIGSLFEEGSAFSTISTYMTSLAGQILDGIANCIPTLVDSGKRIVEAIGNAITNADWETAFGNAATIANKIFNLLGAAIDGASDLAVAVVDAIVDALANADWQSIDRGLDKLGTAIWTGIVNISDSTAKGLHKVGGEIIRAMFGDTVAHFLGFDEEGGLLQALGLKTPTEQELIDKGTIRLLSPEAERQMLIEAGYAMDEVNEILKSKYPEIQETLDETLKYGGGRNDLLNGGGREDLIKDEVDTIAEAAIEEAGVKAPEVQQAVNDMLAPDSTLGSTTEDSQTVANVVDELTKQTVADALAAMNEEEGRQIGGAFVAGIADSIMTGKEAAVTNMKTVADSVVAAAMNGMVSVKAKLLGFNFAAGVANGIKSGIDLITAAAKLAAKAAVDTMTTELDIGSPSRVAEKEIGYMFDLGLSKGIEGGAKEVSDSVRRISDIMRNDIEIGDPSRGTVYSSQRTAEQNAEAAANANRNTLSDLVNAIRSTEGIDYNRLEEIIKGLPINVNVDGRRFAESQADNAARANTNRSRAISLGYGR